MAKLVAPPSNSPSDSADTSEKRSDRTSIPNWDDGSAPVIGRQPNLTAGFFATQPLDCGLYVVATPIGNLMDITFRAIDVLRQADVIACEDTRVTGKLLKHYGISTRMIVYNDHSGPKARPLLLADLKAGKRIALVSDAGTPLISDPGYKLVSECAENGIRIIPIPGASAMLAGLVTSGLPTDKVLYAGFLPSKQKARRSSIQDLAAINATLVFYETGPRLRATLADLATHLGPRPATVARELTKLFEEITRDTLPGLAKSYSAKPDVKGEVVILVGPPVDSITFNADETEAAILDALETMSIRDAAATVADLTGQPKRAIYAQALHLKKKMHVPKSESMNNDDS